MCDLHYNVKTVLNFIHVCIQVREEEKNQRQDLFILATSYSGQLKAKSASMIGEKDFHQVSDKVTLFLALLAKRIKIPYLCVYKPHTCISHT
jgi:hypothetical protein